MSARKQSSRKQAEGAPSSSSRRRSGPRKASRRGGRSADFKTEAKPESELKPKAGASPQPKSSEEGKPAGEGKSTRRGSRGGRARKSGSNTTRRAKGAPLSAPMPEKDPAQPRKRAVGKASSDLQEQLLSLMREPGYVPMREDALAEALEQEGARDRKSLGRALKRMVQDGALAKIKNGRYILPRDADLVTGEIRFRQSGSAVLLPEATEGNPSPEPFQIHAEDTAVALHGDRVVARQIKEPRQQRRRGRHDPNAQYARVLEVLKRKRDTLPGTLMKSRTTYYVVPDDPRIIQDVLVPDPAKNPVKQRPRVNDKVIVRLREWKQRHLNPEGEIVEVLGKTFNPEAEFKSILHKYNLETDFPAAVLREVESIPDKVQDADIQGRQDCRDLFCLTIDPDDAKDFDDALTLESLEGGGYRVGIHIADVSFYVKPGSELMKEARKRGNSTYLVGTVLPMLPHALSNGICSLVERQDRLTKSVFLSFDGEAKLTDTQFANTVIYSRKRLTYRQAYAFLNEDSNKKIRELPLPPAHQTGSTGRPLSDLRNDELDELREAVRALWSIASRLRKARMRKGSLDLDMPETKIFVDEKGYADRIERIENDESHQLIEEFMLSANEAVGRAMRLDDMPCIYRVHDKPEATSLDELRETVATFGIKVGDLTNRREMTRLIEQINKHPQGHNLKINVLRAMKQAQYRASPDGHYGLAKEDYLHFTSPIRRLADLMVHQSFDRYLKRHRILSAPAKITSRMNAAQLASLAEHISITERNSMEAERESVKTKLLEFFEREMKSPHKQSFKAIITDLKNHGMFIELAESMAFGLVHISTLRDDLYHLSSDGAELIGRRTGKRYKLGDKIDVEVDRVDRFKRQIDFRMAK
ncbi:MAG: ribonuclease R family protein [Verrucomicrobiota bacterium]